MTGEERLDRVEHFTAALAEERRKDREEYKQLWRDSQRRMDELSDRLDRFAQESREADRRLGARIEQLAEEGREQDRRLGERIDGLVSGIGEFLSRQKN